MVDPEVRLSIGQQHRARSNDASELVQSKEHRAEANVSQEDEGGFAATEHGAAGSKVALAQDVGCGPLETGRASRDVEGQVHLPSEKLVREQGNQLVDGSVLKHLKDRQDALGIVGLGPGNKRHVLLHMAGVHVVTVVRELPRVVGDQETGVRQEANNVVQRGVLGEGTVTGLVAQDPKTGGNQALNEAVDNPGNGPEGGILNGGDVGDGGPAKSSNHGHIPEQIGHGDGHLGLKAVLGDGGPDGVDIREAAVLLRQRAKFWSQLLASGNRVSMRALTLRPRRRLSW